VSGVRGWFVLVFCGGVGGCVFFGWWGRKMMGDVWVRLPGALSFSTGSGSLVFNG